MALNKTDLDGLEKLLEKSNEFSSLIFDWIAPLNELSLLGRLYDFKATIEAKIAELKALEDEEEHDDE